MRSLFVLAAAGAVLSFPSTALGQTVAPPRISTEAFASQSTFTLPKLSPDGTKLLARMSVKGGTALAVADLAGNGLDALGLPDNSELVRYQWAGNGRIIIVMGQTLPWYDRGDRYVTRAFSYDLASGKTVLLGPKVMGEQGADILWVDPEGKSLLLTAQPDQFSYPSIYRVDLATGRAKVEQTPYDNVWSWYADSKGIVRAGIGYQLDSWFMMYRTSDKDGYKKSPTYSYRADTPDAYDLVPGTDEGYAFANKDGRTALYRYNFATRSLGALVYANETNDVDDADFDNVTGAPISVTYTDDRDRNVWLDPARKTGQANLEKTFGNRAVLTVSRSRDGKRSVLWVGSAMDPGTYYLLDSDTGAIKRLTKVADGVDRAGLSETKYVHYTARDGTDIPAYLTLPRGRDAKDLPLNHHAARRPLRYPRQPGI